MAVEENFDPHSCLKTLFLSEPDGGEGMRGDATNW